MDETIRLNVDVIAVLIVMYIYDMDETIRLNVDAIAVLIVIHLISMKKNNISS